MNDRRVLLDGERPAHITEKVPASFPTKSGLEIIMTRDEAFELLERAKGKTPADWLSWTHLGTALHIAGRTQEGLAACQKALKMDRNALTIMNLAVTLECLGRFQEAFELASEGIRRDPTHQFCGLLWAQGLLRQGRWNEGWGPFEWYSWGTMWEDELGQYIPKWEGEDLNGKKIFVIQNGGFGDNMMFMRWLRDLKLMGAHVTYACPDVMIPVLQGHPWIDALTPTHEDDTTAGLPEVDISVVKNGVKQYDYFVPMMGLAKRFNATVESMQWHGPYIHSKWANHKSDVWPSTAACPRIGICWMGAEKLDPRRHRSLTAPQCQKLLAVENVTWLSLQYDMKPPTYIWQPIIRNWLDTANLIGMCDLVVTVDTGVMHLAGAMGKPTWVILPGLSDWKFLLDREDMVFYPSVRLFRNEGEGLDNALQKVIVALEKEFLRRPSEIMP